VAVLGAFIAVLIVGDGHAVATMPLRCHAATFTVALKAGARFERQLGAGLRVRFEPERLGPDGNDDGWRLTIVTAASANDDYIYPVNPPVRFNGIQIFGPSNGDDTKAALAHAHVVRFLLNRDDYDWVQPLLTNVLWPYSAPRPDTAIDEYDAALHALITGQLTCTVTAYETIEGTDSLRRLTLRAKVITPAAFAFAPGLVAKPSACPRVSA
jgi:hypothetical protein